MNSPTTATPFDIPTKLDSPVSSASFPDNPNLEPIQDEGINCELDDWDSSPIALKKLQKRYHQAWKRLDNMEDCLESMNVLVGTQTDTLNRIIEKTEVQTVNFEKTLESVQEFKTCFDEKLDALKDEYTSQLFQSYYPSTKQKVRHIDYVRLYNYTHDSLIEN